MIKRFCEVVRKICPKEMTKEQMVAQLNKWLRRGHPLSVSNLSLFHNGYISHYDTVEELVTAIRQVKASYFTIAMVDKEFSDDRE